MCVYMYTYLYIRMYTHIYIHIYAYIYIYTDIYFQCTKTYMNTFTYAFIKYMYISDHKYIL